MNRAGLPPMPDEFRPLYSPLLEQLLGHGYRPHVIDPLLTHGVIEEHPS